MQFFKPVNYFTVREAPTQAGRSDLIGGGCDCLVPAQPPKEALEARRRQTRAVMTITTPWPTRPRARSPGSAACQIRATDRGVRRHAVKTRSANGKEVVQGRGRSQN
jgi:hypothetical protein